MAKNVAKIRSRDWLLYGALLVGVGAAYLCIRAYGNTLSAPTPISTPTRPDKLSLLHVNDFVHVLLALALIITLAQILGAVFRWIHQPPVVGEMIAGILLGPSLLGHVAPGFAAYILPPAITGTAQRDFAIRGDPFYVPGGPGDGYLIIARQGSDHYRDFSCEHCDSFPARVLARALAISPAFEQHRFLYFLFLFLGVAMSVTAFPVLARILTDRRINKTKIGVLTLACAAIDDVTAWCLLAFVVSVAQAHAGGTLRTVSMAVAYVTVMLFAVRTIVVRMTGLIDKKGRVTQGVLAVTLIAILLSSLTTETIGIHSIFGAFVLGAIIPNTSALAMELTSKLEAFVIVFMLPAFFAFTGLRTQIGLLTHAREWMFCLLIILVASLGKFGGSSIAARLSGFNWREASVLGVLMNTRGLMELIVLNIGLELHVISPALFAMLVIMALATTLASTPILQFITRRQGLEAKKTPFTRSVQVGAG